MAVHEWDGTSMNDGTLDGPESREGAVYCDRSDDVARLAVDMGYDTPEMFAECVDMQLSQLTCHWWQLIDGQPVQVEEPPHGAKIDRW